MTHQRIDMVSPDFSKNTEFNPCVVLAVSILSKPLTFIILDWDITFISFISLC